jgi:hypothetical protein
VPILIRHFSTLPVGRYSLPFRLLPSLPLRCSYPRSTFRAYHPGFASRTVLLGGRQSALQWRRVASQQGSQFLKLPNLRVNCLDDCAEIHAYNLRRNSGFGRLVKMLVFSQIPNCGPSENQIKSACQPRTLYEQVTSERIERSP